MTYHKQRLVAASIFMIVYTHLINISIEYQPFGSRARNRGSHGSCAGSGDLSFPNPTFIADNLQPRGERDK
jgi:hypothetical protein